MRKWRNVRVNYKREKRQEKYQDKRRKYIHSEILTFLDTACQNNRHSKNNVDHQNDSKDCPSIPDVDTNSLLQLDLEEVDFKDEFSSEVSENKFQIDSVSLQNTPAEDLKTTASREFLLSLLPDVMSLNERQNMQFRLDVSNLINDLRFSNKFQN
ncbi:uncharacterized protein LOC120352679 [Nilaparvata lugens]|uniref:uncharacterized protein LOC120352679 n=1 Tax=Nilaparvata lugens TaxID=108931 RepID=UPI00193EACBD|nr:uncharacterized protein LOC120352679 [Nilaparvata lugens]XP_039290314.1 uncharacterized protein LOC120352679 [Nilaparvata lugens]